MKKLVLVLVLIVLAMAAVFGTAIWISQRYEVDHSEQKILDLSEHTGLRYLGLIDVRKISKNSGYVYDGTRVADELLRRAGLDDNYETWISDVSVYRGVDVRKLTVYEKEQNGLPMVQKKVKVEYLYGEIF